VTSYGLYIYMFLTMKVVYETFRIFVQHLWVKIPFLVTYNSQFVPNYLSMTVLRTTAMKTQSIHSMYHGTIPHER
jgi:hypothetical protein